MMCQNIHDDLDLRWQEGLTFCVVLRQRRRRSHLVVTCTFFSVPNVLSQSPPRFLSVSHHSLGAYYATISAIIALGAQVFSKEVFS